MENVPAYISGTFIAIVIACVGFIFYAVNFISLGKKNFTPTIVLTSLCIWIFLISILAFNDFFINFSQPPRLLVVVGMCIAFILFLLLYPKSRAFLNRLPITSLTYIHIIRVPVEMVLLWLGIIGSIPMDLTFEGSNFDIVAGITAPFVGVFLIGGRSKNKVGAIIWNVLALGLLANIVIKAISYTPYFYTPIAGGPPSNQAVFYFPFILLPTLVVPIVLFSHLVSINQLLFVKD